MSTILETTPPVHEPRPTPSPGDRPSCRFARFVTRAGLLAALMLTVVGAAPASEPVEVKRDGLTLLYDPAGCGPEPAVTVRASDSGAFEGDREALLRVLRTAEGGVQATCPAAERLEVSGEARGVTVYRGRYDLQSRELTDLERPAPAARGDETKLAGPRGVWVGAFSDRTARRSGFQSMTLNLAGADHGALEGKLFQADPVPVSKEEKELMERARIIRRTEGSYGVEGSYDPLSQTFTLEPTEWITEEYGSARTVHGVYSRELDALAGWVEAYNTRAVPFVVRRQQAGEALVRLLRQRFQAAEEGVPSKREEIRRNADDVIFLGEAGRQLEARLESELSSAELLDAHLVGAAAYQQVWVNEGTSSIEEHRADGIERWKSRIRSFTAHALNARRAGSTGDAEGRPAQKAVMRELQTSEEARTERIREWLATEDGQRYMQAVIDGCGKRFRRALERQRKRAADENGWPLPTRGSVGLVRRGSIPDRLEDQPRPWERGWSDSVFESDDAALALLPEQVRENDGPAYAVVWLSTNLLNAEDDAYKPDYNVEPETARDAAERLIRSARSELANEVPDDTTIVVEVARPGPDLFIERPRGLLGKALRDEKIVAGSWSSYALAVYSPHDDRLSWIEPEGNRARRFPYVLRHAAEPERIRERFVAAMSRAVASAMTIAGPRMAEQRLEAGGSLDEAIARWAARLSFEYPKAPSYDHELYHLKLQNLYQDDHFEASFGTTYDALSPSDMALIAEALGELELAGEIPSAFGEVAPFSDEFDIVGTLIGVEAKRVLGEWKAEVEEKITGLTASPEAFATLAALDQAIEEPLKTLWPSERKAVSGKLADARERLAVPVATLRAKQAMASAGDPASARKLLTWSEDNAHILEHAEASERERLEARVVDHLSSVVEASAKRLVSRASGLDGARKLAAWRAEHGKVLDAMPSQRRQAVIGSVKTTLDGLLEDLLRPEIERLAALGSGLEAVEAGNRWFERLRERFAFAFSRPPCRRAVEALRERRPADLAAARSAIEATLEEQSNHDAVERVLSRYLRVPGDRATKPGKALRAGAEERKRSIDRELYLARFSPREQELMVSLGQLDVPSEYSAPSAEEIRLAFLREIDALGGEMLGPHRAKYTIPPFGMFGLYLLVNIDSVELLETQPAHGAGYAARFRISANYRLSENFGDILNYGSSGPSFQARMAQKMLDFMNSAPPLVTEHRFVLTASGWRSPTVRAKGLQAAATFYDQAGEALGNLGF